jgi:hypothetical protein
LLRGIGVKTKVVFSITTTMPTRRLLAAVKNVQAAIIAAMEPDGGSSGHGP